MFKKGLILVISILTVFMMLGGCAGSPGSQAAANADGQTQLFGQIEAIDGGSITIAVGTRPERPQMDGAEPGADATSSATTEDGEDATATTGGNEHANGPQGGAPPSGDTSRGDGNAPNGTAFGGLTLTGEKQTIIATDNTVITIQSGKAAETGSLDDLQIGDIVTVTTENSEVTSITVMRMGMTGGGDAPGPQNSSNTGSPA